MFRRVLVILAALAVALVLAVPAGAAVRPVVAQLPDGELPPIVRSVELLAPGSHNELLEADIVVEVESERSLRGFEYRWNRGGDGDIEETTPGLPTVSYRDVMPETAYMLELRAIDEHGWESDWYTAWEGITPSAPNVIVAGDSVASGYSRQWFTQDSTCRDEGYSYGSTVRDAVAAELPAQWAPTYANIAWPGAGVGDVLNGGSDSCSDNYPSQVDEIERLADPTTWNVVVMTAGINSTNWVDVITDLTADTAFSLFDSGDKKACQDAVANEWNLEQRRSFITDVTADIVDQLAERTNASVYWTSYYELAGTRLAPLWSPVGPECTEEMDYALGQLHSALRAGLPRDVTWVDLTGSDVTLQRWAGWPHPNPDGHEAIGLAVATAVTS